MIDTPTSTRIESQTRLADEISAHFRIPCSKQQIQNWQRRWEPPFPRPLANGSYDRASCFEWMEKIYLPKQGSVEGESLLIRANQAKQQREIDRQQRERLELEKEKGLYVLRADAVRSASGAIRTHHQFVKKSIESRGPLQRKERLIELGVSPDIAAVFHAWDVDIARATIDDIESWCGK